MGKNGEVFKDLAYQQEPYSDI